MAPGDGPTQRSLALGQVARPAGEEVEARRQPLEDRLGPEHADPCRGQLDRERQTFDPVDDRADGHQVGLAADRIRPNEARAVEEELHPALRIERLHAILVLTRDPEPLAAGDDDAQSRRRPDECRDVRRGLGEQLLEVVEDEQRDERLEMRLERPRDRDAGFLGDTEGRRDRALDEGHVADRCEVHEPRPARKAVGDGCGEAQSRGVSCPCRRVRSGSAAWSP